MTTKETKKRRGAVAHKPYRDAVTLVERAKEAFYADPGVIGIGVGPRRRGVDVFEDETALIVFVRCKLQKNEVPGAYLIPDHFEGMKTDVVQPFSFAARRQVLEFADSREYSADMAFVDWDRVDDQWLDEPCGSSGFDEMFESLADLSAPPPSFGGSVPPRPIRLPSNPNSAYIVEWSADMPEPRQRGGFDPDRAIQHSSPG